MTAKIITLDLENNPSNFYMRQGKHVLFQAYEDMLFPGQENVFRRLGEGQLVRIKGGEDLFVVERIVYEELDDGFEELKLTLRKKDDDEA